MPWLVRCWWDADGLAKGISYIDKKTQKEVQVYGKIVVLAASNCETARLLLNSKSRHPPERHRQIPTVWSASI